MKQNSGKSFSVLRHRIQQWGHLYDPAGRYLIANWIFVSSSDLSVYANVMTFPQGLAQDDGKGVSRRFDHNLWQIVNTTTAEAIRKSQAQ